MRTLFLLFAICGAMAMAQQPGPFAVEHERAFWPDAAGTLAVGSEGLEFLPTKKKQDTAKPLLLNWNGIQQLTLAGRSLEIVTYQDVPWQLGRDRQFRFTLPGGAEETFAGLAGLLRTHLGQRLVVALGAEIDQAPASAQWEIPAKLTGIWRGAEGQLSFRGDALVFATEQAEQSRRWPIQMIETIAQTGPLSLTVTAPERALADHGGHRSFQFQLKQPLSAERYQQLWRAIERAKGTRLRFADSQ
ncbi:MAG: hypothetical protein U5J83_18235 [Bryobacterales bacterium]|nr:hypothetical protein [Bryobacterales bacterium]